MPLDYSKWDNIEVSDDEDDTHPNVDTPSLFRWRHKARMEREDGMRKERFELDRQGDKLRSQIQKLKVDDPKRADVEQKYDEWKNKDSEMADKERKAPRNVDNLSKEREDKVIVNKPRKDYKSYDKMTDEEKENTYKEFMEKHRENVKQFGFMKKPKDSEAFLRKFPELVCDHTANFLVVWCIDLCVEEKTALMEQVAHQTISMQFIMELAKGMNRHPADCFTAFYKRLEVNDSSTESKNYHSAFLDELNGFKERVKIRAAQRLEEAKEQLAQEEEYEEVEMSQEERIAQSPGGLDPSEVFENLPEELQQCFISRETETLSNLIQENPRKYMKHMRACVLSGLWVPSEDSPLHVFTTEEGKNLKVPGDSDDEEEEQEAKIVEIEPEKEETKKVEEPKQAKAPTPAVSCLDEVD